MLRVGLTGGIAAGKSRVLAGLAAAGLDTLDLDAVAHEVMAPGGPVHAAVVAAFGPEVLDEGGRIDRVILGRRVFADASARRRLDALVHPAVRAEEAARAERARDHGREVMVTDAALLVEAGMHLRFQRLVVAHCRAEQQLERLVGRSGLDAAAARARIAAQMPGDEKRRFAHFVVDTSQGLAQTDAAAARLAEALRSLARRPGPAAIDLALAAGFLAGAPRPPDVAGVAAWLAEAGELDLSALAPRLGLTISGPWWSARPAGEPAGHLVALTPLLAVWCGLRHEADPAWLAGALFSVGRLLGAAPETLADALVVASAALWRLVPAGEPDLDAWVKGHAAWVDSPPSRGTLWQVERALRDEPPEGPVEHLLTRRHGGPRERAIVAEMQGSEPS